MALFTSEIVAFYRLAEFAAVVADVFFKKFWAWHTMSTAMCLATRFSSYAQPKTTPPFSRVLFASGIKIPPEVLSLVFCVTEYKSLVAVFLFHLETESRVLV